MSRTLFDEAKLPPIPELVERFLESLRTEKNASPHTTLNYEIDLRHWLKFIFESGGNNLERMTSLKELRSFLAKEKTKYSKATIMRRLSVIKGFLKFLHREGYVEKNVASLIRLPRSQSKLPDVLQPDEMIRLIEEMPSANLRQKRTKAIMELLYSTGLRVSEVASLTHESVNFKDGTVKVRVKGNRERIVPMGRPCRTAIQDYVDSIPAVKKQGAKTPLFMNAQGDAISVRSIQRTVNQFAVEILGVTGQKVTPHLFRHSCATHLLARGAGLREIQELLGHRSLVTTQRYTQVNIEHLRKTVQATHPLETRSDKSDRPDLKKDLKKEEELP